MLDFWSRPHAATRPDNLYSIHTVLDRLDMEPDQAHILADWRRKGIGPAWTETPDGEIRYYGWALLDLTMPIKF